MSLNTTPRTFVTGEIETAAIFNAEVRDAFTGIQAAWTAYTPAWTGSGGNPVIGNGTITGAYLQIGKTITAFWAKVIAGTTTTYGAGNYSLSLPVAPHASFVAPLLCRYKIGASNYTGVTYQITGSAAAVGVDVSAGGGVLSAVTPTIPGTFANLSEIHLTGSYQAA